MVQSLVQAKMSSVRQTNFTTIINEMCWEEEFDSKAAQFFLTYYDLFFK